MKFVTTSLLILATSFTSGAFAVGGETKDRYGRVARYMRGLEDACERILDGAGSISLVQTFARASDALILNARHATAIVRGREYAFMAEYNRRIFHPPETARQREARRRDRFAAVNTPWVRVPADFRQPAVTLAARLGADLDILTFDCVLFTSRETFGRTAQKFAAGTIVFLNKETNLVEGFMVIPRARLATQPSAHDGPVTRN